MVLGAALIASTPIIVVALNLSSSGESFGFLLILWFYVGGLDSFAVLLPPKSSPPSSHTRAFSTLGF